MQTEKLIYAHSLDAYGADLHNKESLFSNDDFPMSSLINEDLSDSMSFYYGKFDGRDSLACGNLLLLRSRWGKNAAWDFFR